jgi:hypothetical protein
MKLGLELLSKLTKAELIAFLARAELFYRMFQKYFIEKFSAGSSSKILLCFFFLLFTHYSKS